MIENPIVNEIRDAREQMLAEFDGDLLALLRDAQRRTEEAGRAGRVVVTRHPRPVRPPAETPRKAG